jgi:hypothetical protein
MARTTYGPSFVVDRYVVLPDQFLSVKEKTKSGPIDLLLSNQSGKGIIT